MTDHGVTPQFDDREPQLAVREAAFSRLLENGEPIQVETLVEDTGLPRDELTAAVELLARQGRLRHDRSGRIVGVAGLSVEPTSHQIEVDGTTRWAWCAVDAVGILGALGRGGRITSTPPDAAAPVQITFDGAEPAATGAAIFVAEEQACGSVVEEWCPQVNFFPSAAAAGRWAERTGVRGAVLSVAEATELASEGWRSLLEGR
ncbi:MAG: organomercurial lyase [Acidimicrobiia bacterium]